MLKKLLATTALSALLVTPALAQDTTDPDATIDPPAMEETAPEQGNDPLLDSDPLDAPETDAPDMDAPDMDAPDTDAPEMDAPETDMPEADPIDGAADPGAAPAGDTVLADDVIGADLVDFEGNSIASVDDVVMDTEGGVESVLVDVGGFLGFGAKTVAISLDDITIDVDADGETVLRTALTAEDLENLPEYEAPEEPATEM